jgi:hypothetical protein
MDNIQQGQATQATISTEHAVNTLPIVFPNGNSSLSVTALPDTSATTIIRSLGIQPPKVLFLVIGRASSLDEQFVDRLKLLCNLGIARQAIEAEAIVIDGGTEGGIMKIMGEAIAERGYHSILLGIAPSGTVTYPGALIENAHSERVSLDPNHSHFVLVEGNDWGVETETMYKLADELCKNMPVVTLLINGEENAKREAWNSVQRGWPLLIMRESGKTADEIADAWEKKQAQQQNDTAPNTDPVLTEIIERGDIHLFPIDGTIERFEKLLKQLLYRTSILSSAWELFALYDKNAARQRKYFERIQIGIISIGVIATAMVVLQVLLRSYKFLSAGTFADQFVHSIIVLLPIIISVLIAGVSRFTPGSKWILLRSSAETIKREIYRYRTETGEYKKESASSTPEKPAPSPQEKFAQKIADLSQQLMLTEMNTSALQPYTDAIPPQMYGAEANDDGYSKLSPDAYISIRIGDQISYFRGRINELSRDLTRYYWLILIVGSVGTLLAALGVEPIVALTAALAAAFASYLEYRQTEHTLIKYNQTLFNLNSTKNLWMGFSEEKRIERFDALVNTTEQILESENVGWVRQMHDALAALSAKQDKDAKNQHQLPDIQDDARAGQSTQDAS